MRVVVRTSNNTGRVVAIYAAYVSLRDSLRRLNREALARKIHISNQALLVRHADLFALSLVGENVSRRALRFSECGILVFEHLRVLAL